MIHNGSTEDSGMLSDAVDGIIERAQQGASHHELLELVHMTCMAGVDQGALLTAVRAGAKMHGVRLPDEPAE